MTRTSSIGTAQRDLAHTGMSARRIILLVQGVLGLTWLRAGLEKLTNPHFTTSMKFILGAFASHNPRGWFREFLTSTAIPHAAAFGRIVEFSEAAVGIALVASAVFGMRSVSRRMAAVASGTTVAALVGGTLMNINYWLATSWMGPADDTLNILMVAIQLVLAVPLVLAMANGVRTRRAASMSRGRSARAAASAIPTIGV